MMRFFDSFLIAVRSLMVNKLRSSLTMLGIIIGVSAVISLLSVGRGVETMITTSFESLGSNLLKVQSQNPDLPGIVNLSGMATSSNTVTVSDAAAIAEIPSVITVAPVTENYADIVNTNKLSMYSSMVLYLIILKDSIIKLLPDVSWRILIFHIERMWWCSAAG